MKRISFILLISIPFCLHAQESPRITLEDIYLHQAFRAKTVSGLRSMNDGRHYTAFDDDLIVKYSYETGLPVDTLFHPGRADETIGRVSDYAFSSDEKRMLLVTGFEKIYRRSFLADYYVWEPDRKNLIPVSENGKQQVASFSPDGKSVAFVRNNNLFVKNLETGDEKQLTTDGEQNRIINGHTDWVYEEEFAFTRAYAWSPDNRHIAYYRFDESEVPLFHMTLYEDRLYPRDYTFKYPKAGEKNAVVEIWVVNTETGRRVKMDIGPETDQYIPRIKWTHDSGVLGIIRMNRLQNRLDIMLAVPRTGYSQVVYTEKNERYISEVSDDYLTFLPDGKRFLIYSEKDGYNHFYLYDLNGNLLNQVTRGEWDVHNLLCLDERRDMLYYTASEESPLRRDVYRIRLDGKRKEKLSTMPGTNRAVFSRSFDYYIMYHSSVSTPTLITLHDRRGRLLRVLEDNAALKEKVQAYGIPEKEFFTFTTSEGVELNGWMIKPAGFDPGKKYPVLMRVYGGPGSQTVTDSWDFGWNQYLAQKGILVVSVDNRGTGARGEAFKKMTYGQLGKYETIDQTEAARYLGSLPYVDAGRIGIFGWSYGGFMASSCLFKSPAVFSLAVAGAPVTSWRYYDTVYTERYMGLPQDNPDGYDDNSPLHFTGQLKGKFLLIHGTGDDNVHFQNSAELVRRLVQENKTFDMHFYTDQAHGFRGGVTNLHLYRKISSFIEENL
ncbi:MAG TPA: S9 family peptidase [Bacteroidetes bacterium]|nr:S9 family peptidase [Bacteroidota bacterium]